MSRIGKKVINIPANVTLDLKNGLVTVKGPKGALNYKLRPEIDLKISDAEVFVEVTKETKHTNAYWGLSRALIANMILGVTEGFQKKLELVGVGYRVASISPSKISLAVGYSHPVEFIAPEGVILEVADNKNITISGFDKQLVGLTAAQIRKVRKPEPYKGKGIKYDDEVIRRKAGKTGKK